MTSSISIEIAKLRRNEEDRGSKVVVRSSILDPRSSILDL